MADAFQTRFADALRSGDSEGLTDFLRDPTAPGFAVYRNNVVRSIIDALGDAYPAVKRLVGEQFFAAMTRDYWQAHPPAARTLTLYGAHFADHIAAWKPAEKLTYLPDVARIDRAWLEAHHAEDAAPLTVKQVQAMPPEKLGAHTPGLHPSVRRIKSEFPAWSIWQTNREDDEVRKIVLTRGSETTLVHRPHGDVKHCTLTPAEAQFLTRIAEGGSFDDASRIVANAFPGADPAPVFIHLLTEGVFRGTVP